MCCHNRRLGEEDMSRLSTILLVFYPTRTSTCNVTRRSFTPNWNGLKVGLEALKAQDILMSEMSQILLCNE